MIKIRHASIEVVPEGLRKQLSNAIAKLACSHSSVPCADCLKVAENITPVIGGALMVAAYGNLYVRKDYTLAGRAVIHILKAAQEREGK